MIKKSLASIPAILGLGCLILASILVVRLESSQAAASVTPADLQIAGFTQVKQLTPIAGGRFSGPNLYWQVSDKVTAPTSEAPDVVMAEDFLAPYTLSSGATLYVYGSDSHAFGVTGGNGQEATMGDGRIAINFIKNNHYDVIMGPNQAKIEALASIMAGKIQ